MPKSKNTSTSWDNATQFLAITSVILIVVFSVFISTENNLNLENNKILENITLTSDIVNKVALGVSVGSIFVNVILQTLIRTEDVLVPETK